MPELPDNCYTFSVAELAEIKETYQLLLADKHAHNRQFKKRERHFQWNLVILLVSFVLSLSLCWLTIRLLGFVFGMLAQGMDLRSISSTLARYPTTILIIMSGPLVMLLVIIEFVWIKHKKDLDRYLFNQFPTSAVRYNHTPYLKTFHIQQMIKLPDYLIIWPVAKERQIIPTPDQVSCWIIRKADQPAIYNKLSTTYYNNLLKNPKASRWVDYWLIDGTKKDN
ncbi:hypothetical protein [Oenococcus kitaharae]|uniref:hypothetical protein n=1 Tax=Oenococcus TaxID=46254 RepID=UPI0021E86B04|nr:hypothetical protein [Oenococcus kitaharae]MCV3296736.1 hypothetical protein [Oenococcus kitaharae]